MGGHSTQWSMTLGELEDTFSEWRSHSRLWVNAYIGVLSKDQEGE